MADERPSYVFSDDFREQWPKHLITGALVVNPIWTVVISKDERTPDGEPSSTGGSALGDLLPVLIATGNWNG